MMPNQKLGIEIPKNPNIEPKLSTQEFGFAPAHTPSGMPKMIAISIEAIANSMVAGSRSPIKVITGSEYRNDVPRIPDQQICEKLQVLDVDRLIQPPTAPRIGNVLG